MDARPHSPVAVAAHLAPSPAELLALRQVAVGERPADLLIEHARVLCLHTREVLTCHVAVCGAFIAAVVPTSHSFSAVERVDAEGAYLAPTLIDTHIHIEYSLVTPGEFARCVVPRGTGCVLADPNCVGNVLGQRGMAWAGDTTTPLKILQQVSHRIPRAPALELGGALVSADEQLAMLASSNAVGVGESVPFGFDARAAELQSAALAMGKRNTGHSARVDGATLWGYAATGVGDDHNAFSAEEVAQRLRLGMMITVMSGSMNDNVPLTFAEPGLHEQSYDRFSFCADDKHVGDLHRQGHIDHHVREAIRAGVPTLEAYRMATLNAATYYRLDHVIGAVVPARRADFMLLDDLADVRPHSVWLDGVRVATTDEVGARCTFRNDDPMPDWLRDTMHLTPQLGRGTFAVPAEADADEVALVRAMEMYDGYFKRAIEVELPVLGGSVTADPDIDVAKITVLDRHHAQAVAASGFVRGFGLRRGALAATTNCENQNLVVLGTNDDDMLLAARTLAASGGGYVAVGDGVVLETLPLPLAGIMSDQPWERVIEEADAVDRAAADLGCRIAAPFMILAFVGLAGVPDYGLTERGLIEASSQRFVPVVLCCRCPQHTHHPQRGPRGGSERERAPEPARETDDGR